jgi:hypothetical protein
MSMFGGETKWLISDGAGVGDGFMTAAVLETFMRRLGILRGAVSKDSSGSFGLTEENSFAMRWVYNDVHLT